MPRKGGGLQKVSGCSTVPMGPPEPELLVGGVHHLSAMPHPVPNHWPEQPTGGAALAETQ